jgi:hypothetical protein
MSLLATEKRHFLSPSIQSNNLDILSNHMEDSKSSILPEYFEEQKVKSKLLEDQANEISCQFQSIIQELEDALLEEEGQDDEQLGVSTKIVFIKKILMQTIKIFNEFLCIESVFKIDCNTLKIECEPFLLKDQFFYSVDSLLSLTENSEVTIIIDP